MSQSFHTQQVRCRCAQKDREREKENLSESASLFFAAERSVGIVQIIQLDLDRRDGPLQIFILALFSGDLIGIDGVIVRRGLLIPLCSAQTG